MHGRTYHSSRSAIVALLLGAGALSRAEIARRTGLSRATISLAMAELLAEGVVQEIGAAASTGGRRPVLVRLGGDRRFVIGGAFEPDASLFTLVDLDGQVVSSVTLEPPARGEPASLVERAGEGLAHLTAGLPTGSVLAAGFSMSGQANARATTFSSGTWLFEDQPMPAMMQAALGAPAVVLDNAHAAALGELWRRGREHRAHLIYFYMGIGVGGAIVTERSLYTGANQAAGEIGAVILDPNGPDFGHHRGCFEGFVSYGRLRDQIEAKRGEGVATALPEELPDDSFLDLLSAAADAEDVLALEILDEAARYTGLMAGNLIDILNPDEIIIGGPYGQLGSRFTDLVTGHAARTALPASFASVRILPGAPIAPTAALGAAAAALTLAPGLLA